MKTVNLHPRAGAGGDVSRRALLREVVGAQIIPDAREDVVHDEPQQAQDDQRRGLCGNQNFTARSC